MIDDPPASDPLRDGEERRSLSSWLGSGGARAALIGGVAVVVAVSIGAAAFALTRDPVVAAATPAPTPSDSASPAPEPPATPSPTPVCPAVDRPGASFDAAELDAYASVPKTARSVIALGRGHATTLAFTEIPLSHGRVLVTLDWSDHYSQVYGHGDELMLLDLESGVALWTVGVADPASSITYTRTGADGDWIAIVSQTAVGGTTLSIRSLADGAEMSSLALEGPAWLGEQVGSAPFRLGLPTTPPSQSADTLIVVTPGETFAVEVADLSRRVWVVPGTAYVQEFGDVVLIDGTAYDRSTGVALDWTLPTDSRGTRTAYDLDGRLFAGGDGGVVPLDPSTGDDCADLVEADAVVDLPHGWASVRGGIVQRHDGTGVPVGDGVRGPVDSVYVSIGDRIAAGTGDGLLFLPTGDEAVQVGTVGAAPLGFDGSRYFALEPAPYPSLDPADTNLVAYDLDSGAVAWSARGFGDVRAWAGSLVDVEWTAGGLEFRILG